MALIDVKIDRVFNCRNDSKAPTLIHWALASSEQWDAYERAVSKAAFDPIKKRIAETKHTRKAIAEVTSRFVMNRITRVESLDIEIDGQARAAQWPEDRAAIEKVMARNVPLYEKFSRDVMRAHRAPDDEALADAFGNKADDDDEGEEEEDEQGN